MSGNPKNQKPKGRVVASRYMTSAKSKTVKKSNDSEIKTINDSLEFSKIDGKDNTFGVLETLLHLFVLKKMCVHKA